MEVKLEEEVGNADITTKENYSIVVI